MDSFLLLAFLFLVAGAIAVPIASRLGLGSVLGYLLAGIAISPLLHALHVVDCLVLLLENACQGAAEAGVNFLLAGIALIIGP